MPIRVLLLYAVLSLTAAIRDTSEDEYDGALDIQDHVDTGQSQNHLLHGMSGLAQGPFTKLNITGFSSDMHGVDRAFLNGEYTENSEILIGGLPTFWGGIDNFFFVYYCSNFKDWRIGTANDWSYFKTVSTACACLAFAHSPETPPQFPLEQLTFPGIQDGEEWNWILPGAKVDNVHSVSDQGQPATGVEARSEELRALNCSDPSVAVEHNQTMNHLTQGDEGTGTGAGVTETADTGFKTADTDNAFTTVDGGNDGSTSHESTAGETSEPGEPPSGAGALPSLNLNIHVQMDPAESGGYVVAGEPQVEVKVIGQEPRDVGGSSGTAAGNGSSGSEAEEETKSNTSWAGEIIGYIVGR